jgi:hypothetical protein
MSENVFGFFSTKRFCDGCGCPLDSSSRYCIPCYRQRTRPCPECLTPRGQLKYAYQRHRWTSDTVECPRCGVPHQDLRQPTCPRCRGQHFIFAETTAP